MPLYAQSMKQDKLLQHQLQRLNRLIEPEKYDYGKLTIKGERLAEMYRAAILRSIARFRASL
jgi:hypothetical protein